MLELPPDWSVQSKDLVVWQYKENEYLIRPGDKDESVIIVLEGIIAVYISHTEGKEHMVRKISVGDSFFSLLSVLDVFMVCLGLLPSTLQKTLAVLRALMIMRTNRFIYIKFSVTIIRSFEGVIY
ncbi:unnamed protein product [Gongylonema pulchrum]|uniref:Cyclic nucleotide-binding domain-containing protein n=1 Tax=Gongylonema pulchrum TaxID=637853 RepID=A0A183DI75_9BILA|nr:unnamed protein product [Gongylonema pulchrum]